MRKGLLIFLGIVAVIVVGMIAIAGVSVYVVMRNMDASDSTAEQAAPQFDQIRSRFLGRSPLVELLDARRGNVRINYPDPSAERKRLSELHIQVWQAEEQKLTRTKAPMWMVRFGTTNLAAKMGVNFGRTNLTVEDIERYGAGLIVDYKDPDGSQVLVWAQ